MKEAKELKDSAKKLSDRAKDKSLAKPELMKLQAEVKALNAYYTNEYLH